MKKQDKLDYRLIDKALYFPKKKIIVIGDLHLGYEHQLIQSGILTPKTQMKNLLSNLKKVLRECNAKKIIFLGDIKHSFGYEKEERFNFVEIYEFLREKFDEKDIIFIKGNHDTIDYSFSNKMKEYYISGEIMFIHGHKSFVHLYDKKIKTIVMGHIHPSVEFKDKDTNKKERYKCFLTGKFKKKDFIVMPSFLGLSIGQPVNEYSEEGYEDYFSILPKKAILKFEVHVLGKDKIYEFGKVSNLN